MHVVCFVFRVSECGVRSAECTSIREDNRSAECATLGEKTKKGEECVCLDSPIASACTVLCLSIPFPLRLCLRVSVSGRVQCAQGGEGSKRFSALRKRTHPPLRDFFPSQAPPDHARWPCYWETSWRGISPHSFAPALLKRTGVGRRVRVS